MPVTWNGRRAGALGHGGVALLLVAAAVWPAAAQPAVAWAAVTQAPERSGGQPMAIEPFNRLTVTAARKGESWTRSPLLVVLKFVGENCACSSRQIELKSTPERFADAVVTVSDQGYLDDSVRGYSYQVVLAKQTGGHWQLTRATRAWNCWKGRGHEGFSTEPCT